MKHHFGDWHIPPDTRVKDWNIGRVVSEDLYED